MPFLRRSLTAIEERLGYRFRRPELLELACTHRSYANEQGIFAHYERLEFLGDSVLGMVVSRWLYDRYPDLPEGDLSKLKSHLVSKTVLAPHAEALQLGSCLRLGVGEERSGGRTKPSLLADSMEAVFGALYLDGGLAAAETAIRAMLEQAFAAAPVTERPWLDGDPKTRLQELTQAWGRSLPEYRLTGSSGPDHNKVFAVQCWVAGEQVGQGEGPSKKLAEQRAASDALSRLAPADDGEPGA